MLARLLYPALLQSVTDGAAPESLSESLRLLDLPQLWVVVLLIAPLVLLVSIAGYLRETLPRGARNTLIVLRAASLALLLIVIFRPVWVQQQENVPLVAYNFFIGQFVDAIRYEIARSAERSYDSLRLRDMQKMFMIDDEDSLTKFITQN